MVSSNLILTLLYLLFIASSIVVPLSFRGNNLGAGRYFAVNTAFMMMVSAISLKFTLLKNIEIASPFSLSLGLCVILLLIAGPWRAIASLAAFSFFTTATWWVPELQLGLVQSSLFLTIGLLAIALAYMAHGAKGLPATSVIVVVAGLGILANGLTAPLLSPLGFGVLWHHWGVYLAPAELLLAGGIPFNDFPVQYGFGPMSVMALGCLGGCWNGTYIVVALSNLAHLLAMTAVGILLLRDTVRGLAVCTIIALVVSILFWTTYPPDLLGVLATPSTGGIRFLPLSLLVLFIVKTEIDGTSYRLLGHLLWITGVVWSPEAAFFVTLVWWPYLALYDVDMKSETHFWPVLRTLSGWFGKAVLSLSVVVPIFAIMFTLIFGEWPSPGGFLTYINNPPGLLPVNFQGPVWLIFSTLFAALISYFCATTASGRRITIVCVLALLATFSYYLSRSHDNNILNIFPFLVLVLACVLRLRPPAAVEGFAKALLIAIVAWSATFGIKQWSTAWDNGALAEIGMGRIFKRMDIVSASSWQAVEETATTVTAHAPPTPDAGRAIAELRATSDGAPILVNNMMILPQQSNSPIWTSVTNIANYAPLPPDTIRTFIQRGALRFKRPGWIVIDRNNPGLWLDLFKSGYDISEQRQFGGYDAYRLVPR